MAKDITDVDLNTPVHLRVNNVGGITDTELEIPPGVTVLTGQNATNRTSLLRSLGEVLGGNTAAIKSDCDEGRIELEIDEEYFCDLRKTGSTTSVSGEPFSDEAVIVDHFVSLLEDNQVRRAVEQGEDLRDILMKPVDISEIENRIQGYTNEIHQLDDRINEIQEKKQKLPGLEQKEQELSKQIQKLDEELEEIGHGATPKEDVLDSEEEHDEIADELEEKRNELNHLRNDLEVKQSERNALEEQLDELQEKEEEISDININIGNINAELTELRERIRGLEDDIDALSTIVSFSETVLEGDGGRIDIGAFQTESVTDELAPSNQRPVECWVCGTEVNQHDIEEHLEYLRDQISEKRQKRTELDGEISTLQEKKNEFESREEEISALERRIETTQRKLEQQENTIEDKETRISELEDVVADLEEQLKAIDEQNTDELVLKYEQISDLQFERGKKRERLIDVQDQIEEIESLPDVSDLEKQRTELEDEIEKERTRVEQLEQSAIESFNEHMANLIDALNYENLSRVWLERKVEDDAALDDSSSFDLHIVRESNAGAGYEDSLDNLSESERELIGLVLALSGYLVHEVYRTIPFILMDSLEAIDSERIAKLVEYFEDYSSCLVVALLPEDAAALSDDYHYVSADKLT